MAGRQTFEQRERKRETERQRQRQRQREDRQTVRRRETPLRSQNFTP